MSHSEPQPSTSPSSAGPPNGAEEQEPQQAKGLFDRFPALRKLSLGGQQRRRLRQVQQTTATDCGAACLTMVLDFFGKSLRLDDVRDVVGGDRAGADALAILNAGRWYGLRGRGVKVEHIDSFEFLSPGAILHWRFNHYVVFESWDAKGATVVDPASGRRVVSREELRRSFTGVALMFETAEDFEPENARSLGGQRYIRELKAQSNVLSRVLVMSVLLQLLALAAPLLTSLLVDRVVPRSDYHLLTVLGAGLVAVVVFHFVSTMLRAYLMLQLRTQLDAKITLEFLDHLVALPYAFFQQRSAGDLMMRLNSNTTVREILTTGALSGILDGSLVFLYLIFMFFTHWQLSLLVLLLAGLRIGLFLLTRQRQSDLMSEALQTQAVSRGYQVQLFAGIETLKSIGAEQRAVEQWSNLFIDELNVSLARGKLNAVFETLLATLAMASPFVILIFGTVAVLDGQLSLGVMLAFNALAMGFLGPLSTLISTGVQLQLLGSYLERIDDVLESEPEQHRHEVVPAGRLQGAIQLDGVSFRYGPSSPYVVREVDVDVAAGSFVALVGASGAGKSTLANLLMGLYTPTEGRIVYDGIDLATLELRTVRRQLGIVQQQPYLFGTSIRANIALADPGLSMHRVSEAAKLAQIHDDIQAMPMGYETPLADGGRNLSGGQRQRLALARALAHEPAILLLDEATSHLDALTEKNVHQELASMRATRIVIAHRLSTVVAADLILVMDDGRIVERGSHAELMTRDGRYRDLVAAQLTDDEGDDDQAQQGADA